MLLALSATVAQWVVDPNPMQIQVVFIIPICLIVGICSMDIIFACNFSFFSDIANFVSGEGPP